MASKVNQSLGFTENDIYFAGKWLTCSYSISSTDSWSKQLTKTAPNREET